MVKDEGLLVGELINKTFLLTVAIGAISLIFLFVGILLSTIMKSSRNGISIALGLFFATYFIGIISKLKENLGFLKYFSPSEYFTPGEIIKNGFESKFIIILLLIVIISLITSISVYKRKDL